MAFKLSTVLVTSKSWVEGPFHAFLTLALKSKFTTPQLNFYAKIDDHGIRWGVAGRILARSRRSVASRVALDRPMTGKCAKVMPTSDTFKNSNPEELHTFVEFFWHSSESLAHFTRKHSAETMSQKRRFERESLRLSTPRSPPDLIHGKWPVIKPKPLALNRLSALLEVTCHKFVACWVQLIKCSTGCRAIKKQPK